MDDADRAEQLEQMERDGALRAALSARGLARTGECHNCGERTEHAFCSTGCRDDWQRVQDAKRRNGRQE